MTGILEMINPFAKSPFTRTRFLPSGSSTMVPVQKTLARDLRVLERARAAGLQGLPEPTATEPDDCERDIGLVIAEKISLNSQALANWIGVARDSIEARLPAVFNGRAEIENSESDFAALKLNLAEKCDRLVGAESRARASLAVFRDENLVTRDAEYSRNPRRFWLLMTGVAFTETLFNAFAFAGANANGLMGGIYVSAGVSAANMALGLCAGLFCVRSLRSRRRALRWLGGVGVTITSLAAIVFQAFVVRWRLQGAAELQWYRTATEKTPFPHVTWDDLSAAIQASPEAGVLGILGLAVFSIAMWKFAGGASTPWDQLWGYAKRHLALEKSTEAIRDGHDAYGALATKHIARLRSDDRRRSATEARQMKTIKRIANAIRVRTQEIKATVGEWIVVGGNLLRIYRAANLKARGNLAPPQHFNSGANAGPIESSLPDPQVAFDAANRAATICEMNRLAVAAAESAYLTLAKEGTAEFAVQIDRARVRSRGLEHPSNSPTLSLV